jgi:peptidoglycan biosynthesis protein MviN/MurJ (putative lipid II flippase)
LLGLLLCGYAPAVILTGAGTCICKGIGRIEIETVYVAISLILNIGLTIILVQSVGPTGTVIATALSWAIGSVFFAFYLHRHLALEVEATLRAAKACIAIIAAILLIRYCGPYLIPADRIAAFRSLVTFFPVAVILYVSALLLTGVVPRHAWRALANFRNPVKVES